MVTFNPRDFRPTEAPVLGSQRKADKHNIIRRTKTSKYQCPLNFKHEFSFVYLPLSLLSVLQRGVLQSVKC